MLPGFRSVVTHTPPFEPLFASARRLIEVLSRSNVSESVASMQVFAVKPQPLVPEATDSPAAVWSFLMPQTPHVERHFTASETVRDIVIGMSDGLTVPFALAAGLSGAVEATGIIITAGLAEVAAGAIAMGLGGYLAAS